MRWLAKNKKWLLMVALVLAIGFVGVKFLPLNEWISYLKNWLTTLGFWAMPTFILIYIIATIAGLPVAIMMLVGGTLFGLVRGTISVSVADTLGAGACFLLGRTVARKPIKKWIAKRPQFAELDKAVGRKGWKIVFLTRLSPLVPSNLLNYGFSLTKVNFWEYLFFTWLGMLPVIGLYVYLGSFGGGFLKPGGGNGIVLQVIGLLFTIGVVIYTTRLAKKTVSEAAEGEGKAN